MQISQFHFNDVDVDITYHNGYIAYTFEKDGETYGGKVKPPTKKHIDLISSAFNLALNVLETHEALCKSQPKTLNEKSNS